MLPTESNFDAKIDMYMCAVVCNSCLINWFEVFAGIHKPLRTRSYVKVIKRYSLHLKRDAANTWEVGTAFKPPDVLFSCFLGSMAHDHILEIIYCAVLEKLEQSPAAKEQ
ncbi:hypothetical protein CMV_027214 [Castanea mollissima]|uniref:Uncharacterized protein n=1 Tax=Castanea mollissima TaxID=60419 RepID=A0A8J4Q6V4_9ROSI|nr:hypothetical protein CMV_027214 [Castanea mollissima]